MGIYPEIIDDFDPGFPRDSYNRGESVIITPYVPDYSGEDVMPFELGSTGMYPFEVIGAKKKKRKMRKGYKKAKKRQKKVRRTFKMPIRNNNLSALPGDAQEPSSYDESQGRLTTSSGLEDQYDQDYAANYPDTTMYDGSGDYSEEFGARKKAKRAPKRRATSRKASPRRQVQAMAPAQDRYNEPAYSAALPPVPTDYGQPYQAAPVNPYPGSYPSAYPNQPATAYPGQYPAQYPGQYPGQGVTSAFTTQRGDDPYAYLFEEQDSAEASEEYSGRRPRSRPGRPNRMIAQRGRKLSETKKIAANQKIRSNAEKAQAVSKAIKRLKAQDEVKKNFEEKLSNLEHEIERRDIADNVRERLEDQADEYENMIADLQESQRVELDEIRAQEAQNRQPDSDPTFIIEEDDDEVSGTVIIPTDDGEIVVGASIMLEPIYGEVIAELNNQVGGSLKGFFKKIGKIAKKVANSRITKRLAKLAKTAAASYTGGSSDKFFDTAKELGGSLIKGVKKGDPKSIAIVDKIARDANNGDPDAMKAYATLNREAEKSGTNDMLLMGKAEDISGSGDLYSYGANLGCRNV